MKLAIVGVGRMGRMIEHLAPQHGFEVFARIDAGDPIAAATAADVAIEFSVPEAAAGNIEQLVALGVPVVCGTTGWNADLPRVRAAVEARGGSLVYSANFSIGVNVFTRVVAEASRLLAGESDYGAWAWEIHHAAKKDAPSGTLLTLVDAMTSSGYARPIDISSNRAGTVPGIHEIGFDSVADTITLRHTARGREGFARGALKAARWVIGKRGVWEFSDVLFGRAG
jgi:4-hydroxy-tetrahydrodipicolinate reductase